MHVIRIGGKKGKWEADKKKDFSTIFLGSLYKLCAGRISWPYEQHTPLHRRESFI